MAIFMFTTLFCCAMKCIQTNEIGPLSKSRLIHHNLFFNRYNIDLASQNVKCENATMQYTIIYCCINENFQLKNFNIVIFLPKLLTPTCTHNFCFGTTMRIIVYTCTTKFHYIKVERKGVYFYFKSATAFRIHVSLFFICQSNQQNQ